MAHVVITGPQAWSMENFRGDLILALVRAGHRVTAMSPPASPDQEERIRALGADVRAFPLQRNRLNPWQDLRSLLALRRAYQQLDPDVVLAYTVKTVVWSGLALTGLRRARFVASIEGLGFAFQGGGLLRGSLKRLAAGLCRVALRRAESVVLLNPDNVRTFVTLGVIPNNKCRVVDGAGVNCDRFSQMPLPPGPPRFLLVARLLGEKGLREYAEAARVVTERFPGTQCQLLGPGDSSPDAVHVADVLAWHDQKRIRYLGEADDVRPYLAACHVFVLPSYHEGMPRTVLEAMATGRPILTTDVPGCRETVVDGQNGYLVPRADARALAARMIWFIEHRDQWERMGHASRRLAVDRFDVHRVNEEMFSIMGLAPV